MFLIIWFLCFFSLAIQCAAPSKNIKKGCSHSCLSMDVKYFDKPFIQGLEKYENLYAFLIEGFDRNDLSQEPFYLNAKKVLTDIFEEWYEGFCNKDDFGFAQELKFKIYLLRINYELDLESYQKKMFYEVLNGFKFKVKTNNLINITIVQPNQESENNKIILEDLREFEKCYWQIVDLAEKKIEENVWIDDLEFLIKAWVLEFTILFFKDKLNFKAFLKTDFQPPQLRFKNFDLACQYFWLYLGYVKRLKISVNFFKTDALNKIFERISLEDVKERANSYRGCGCSTPVSAMELNQLKEPLIKELEKFENYYTKLLTMSEVQTIESLSLRLINAFKPWYKKFCTIKSYEESHLESSFRFVMYIVKLNFRLVLRDIGKQATFCALDTFIFSAQSSDDNDTDTFINTDAVDLSEDFIVTELIFYEDCFCKILDFMDSAKFELWKDDLRFFFRSWLMDFYRLSLEGNLNYDLFLSSKISYAKISDLGLVYNYFLMYISSFCRAKLKLTNSAAIIIIEKLSSFKLVEVDGYLYKSQVLNLEKKALGNLKSEKKFTSRCKEYLIPELGIYEGYYEIIMDVIKQASMDNLISEFNAELPVIFEDWYLEFCKIKEEKPSSDITKIKFALYLNEVNLKLNLNPLQKQTFNKAIKSAALKKGFAQSSPIHPGIQVELIESHLIVIKELKDFELLYSLLINYFKTSHCAVEYFACKNDIKKIIQSWQLEFCKMVLSKKIDYGLFESSPILRINISRIGFYFKKYLNFINTRKLNLNDNQIKIFNQIIKEVDGYEESLFAT